MPRPSEDIIWPGGEHTFKLRIAELRAVEQRCNAGAAVVMQRLIGGSFYIDDVIQVLRCGLTGGGMSTKKAQALIEQTLEDHNYYVLSVTAGEIMKRAIFWDEGETPSGK